MKYSEDKNCMEKCEKCRCCTHPSPNFVKLTALSKFSGAEDKTYIQLLNEITNNNIVGEPESKIPKKICRKCIKQLKNAYSFILQARNVYEGYLRAQVSEGEEDLKDFENLHETLIEIPESKDSDEDHQVEDVKLEGKGIDGSSTATVADVLRDSEVILNEEELNDGLEDADGDVFDTDILEDSLDGREQAESHTSNSYDEDQESESASVDEEDLMSSNEPIARRCDVCHKVYRDERALNIHKRFTHMPEEEKIPCPLCNYKTSRSSALKVHMGLIHGAEKVEEYFKPVPVTGKKFPCNLCERGYQRREDLRKHFRKKHKNPQMQLQPKPKAKPPKPKEEQCFLCACCGQSYTSKKALDGHLLSHTGERPYQCDICDKAFKRIKDMKAHRVIHSDEKPFQCSNCGKSFKRADKLKIHMRVHSELRPYKCSECEKTFKYPSVLRTHMHMHTGQTPFSCKTCGEAFSLRTSLNNHCLKNGHVK